MSQKISVIIPTRNRANFLPKTLNSILNQTLSPYEIIVIDNGSTDNTLEILKTDYKNSVITITNKGNYSPGAGRNLGLQIATGDYIQFFDSDDLMTKNKFETQVEILEKNSEKQAVYCPYVMASEEENGNWKQLSPVLQYKKTKISYSKMIKGFFTIIPSFLFRAEIIKKTGNWREDIFAYEDFDYLFRMFNNNLQVLQNNKSCVFYRVHGNQITGNTFNNKQRDIDKVKCLLQILNTNKNKLSSFEKLTLKTMIHRVEDNENKTNISKIKFTATDLYLRIENKINRIITHSDWQIAHSPEQNPNVFQNYMKLL
ncbi:MAG: glycosyltransferase family 2 protein [Bacteroidales bacterium]|nr:glycosyltransferase family 2 protein [Bacteroidales bacterium]